MWYFYTLKRTVTQQMEHLTAVKFIKNAVSLGIKGESFGMIVTAICNI